MARPALASVTATERAHAGSCCDDPANVRWGRKPVAVPPLRWWWPAALLAAAVAVLGVLVTVVVRGPGPLDDPRLGRSDDVACGIVAAV